MKTRIALAQLNCTVGDFAGNAAKILAAAKIAHRQGAHLLLTPELSLTGYPPEDLLLRPSFYAKCQRELEHLTEALAQFPGLRVVVGHPATAAGRAPRKKGNGIPPGMGYNAISVLVDGMVAATYLKRELPNNEVFDEKRYFVSGGDPVVVTVNGLRCGLTICEDVWHPDVAAAAWEAGAQVLLVPNASPYHMDKEGVRLDITRARVAQTGLPLVYVNMVGGQDELVFDGGSFVLNSGGEVVSRMPQFKEGIAMVDFDGNRPEPGDMMPEPPVEAKVYAALTVGVRDYVQKNGFPGAIIGLSGGVDSALVLAIACDALGADKVRAVMMPSRYTADISLTDARDMAQRLGVRYDEIPIAPMFDAFRGGLAEEFEGLPEDTTEENIQARIRGTLLMALSNKYGSIVLTTGNKSEMAVGYCTLYGDMAGGFAVIKDIAKTLVYRLCRYRNESEDFAVRGVIPERILTRAPSAELRDNQTDQDSLPPYEILDAIMRMYMEQNKSRAEIVRAGYSEEVVDRVTRLIKLNEYKRRQAPVGIRVTHRAFGRDWRYPITSKFQE